MTHLTTEQLQAIQTKVDSMLEAIIERLEGSAQLQAAVRHVMRAGDDVYCPRLSNWLLTTRLWRIRCCSRLSGHWPTCRQREQ